jgi:hypothetical protein
MRTSARVLLRVLLGLLALADGLSVGKIRPVLRTQVLNLTALFPMLSTARLRSYAQRYPQGDCVFFGKPCL